MEPIHLLSILVLVTVPLGCGGRIVMRSGIIASS